MKPDRDSIHRRAIRLGAAAFVVGLGFGGTMLERELGALADPWDLFGVPRLVAHIVLGVLLLLLLATMLRTTTARARCGLARPRRAAG